MEDGDELHEFEAGELIQYTEEASNVADPNQEVDPVSGKKFTSVQKVVKWLNIGPEL